MKNRIKKRKKNKLWLLQTIVLALIIFTQSAKAQTEVVNITLDESTTGTQDYLAKEYVDLTGDFEYTASGSEFFHAKADANLVVLEDNGDILGGSDNGVVGSINGQFSVTPTGGASYTMPITVAPGTAGMTPELAIAYNSQSADGLLGIGFNLAGMSLITRCPSTYYHDDKIDGVDFDADDRYMIDGQRLMVDAGFTYGSANATYRTESNDFSRIVSVGTIGNGPEYFIVYTKSGLIKYYGHTSDTRLQLASGDGAIFWLLTKIEDTKGNTITYNYNKEDQTYFEFSISSIEYTSNSSLSLSAYNSIDFTYEARPDIPKSFIDGNTSKITQRLQKIECKTDDVTYRTYTLTYDNFGAGNRSHLMEIKESNKDGEFFNPTKFSWKEGWVDLGWGTLHTVDNNNIEWSSFVFPGDFDGDGKDELFVMPDNNENGIPDSWKVMEASTFVFSDKESTGPPLPEHYRNTYTGDFNGDGLTDILISTNTDTDIHFYLWLSEIDEVTNKHKFVQNSYEISVNADLWVNVGDFNGDGVTDCLIRYFTTISQNNTKIFGGSYNGGNFSFGEKYDFIIDTWADEVHAVEFNGDGKTDLALFKDDELDILLFDFSGASLSYERISTTSDIKASSLYEFGDFNGDGKTDIFVYGHETTLGSKDAVEFWDHSNIFLSTGRNFESHQINSFAFGDITILKELFKHRFHMADYNGDGKTDFFVSYTNPVYDPEKNFFEIYFPNYHLANSDGTEFDLKDGPTYSASGEPVFNYNDNFFVLDIDGYGTKELLHISARDPEKTDGYEGYKTTLCTQDTRDDLLPLITDGLGNTIDIFYKPLSNQTVYTQNSDPAYPLVSYIGASDVVSHVSVNDGIGGTNTITYEYEDAIAHRRGKGLLGFLKTVTYDVESDIFSISSYEINDDYYYLSLKQTEQRLSDKTTGQLISKTILTNKVRDDGQDVYFAYVEKTEEQKYENGSPTAFNTIISNFTSYDTYGNLLESSVEYEDGNKITTVNTYDNIIDIANSKWHLGRLRTSEVTKEATGWPDIERESAFEYYDDGLLKKETIEPNFCPENLNLRLETLYEYDDYGNVIQKTTTDLYTNEQRVSVYAFNDPYHRFITSQTNAELHTQSMTYDPFTGNLLTQTGPNGLTTTFKYDGFGRPVKTYAPGNIQSLTARRWCVDGTEHKRDGAVYFVYSQTSGNEPAIEFFDALGRVVRTKSIGLNGEVILVDKDYDKQGRVENAYLPYFANDGQGDYTHYDYDDFGRVEVETLPDGNTIGFAYNGFTTTVRNQLGQKRVKTVNARGLMVSSKGKVGDNDLGDELTYFYDAAGNLRETKFDDTENGFSILMEYDIMGNRTKLTDPDIGNVTSKYNAFGELVKEYDSKSNITTLKYDLLGRLTNRIETEGETKWFYDDKPFGVGKIIKVELPNGDYEEYDYDELGRIVKHTEHTGSETFITENTYDEFSRVQRLDYPSDFAVEYTYNSYGYMSAVQKAGGGDVYWQAGTMNAKGQWEDCYLGNGNIHTKTNYWDNTGLIKTIMAAGWQNQYYEYDEIGNLAMRNDIAKIQKEEFVYDDFNRLEEIYYNGSATPFETVQYDILGNIKERTGVGVYHYDDANHVHAVTSVDGTLFNTPYTENQHVHYTSFDKVKSLVYDNTYEMNYSYNAERQRTRVQTVVDFSLTATKYYAAGGMYEKEVDETTGDYKEIHYISAGGGVVAIYTEPSTGSNETSYLLKDNLGSVYCYTDEAGTNKEYLSFDAWGNRRDPDNWSDVYPSGIIPTTRGFTGHEHVDMFQLINMNGRMYDPLTGRFLSADPFVQMPDNLQGLNRYSYCLNNPLSLVDPSGYMSEGINSVISAAAQIAVSYMTGNMLLTTQLKPFARGLISSAAGGFAGGFTGNQLCGGDLTESLKAGAINSLWSMASATSYNLAGTMASNNAVTKAFLHGMASGGIAELRGEGFGPAFMSGFFSGYYEGVSDGNLFAAIVVGGTASKIGGGKFSNGAVTGAYVVMFNSQMHKPIFDLPKAELGSKDFIKAFKYGLYNAYYIGDGYYEGKYNLEEVIDYTNIENNMKGGASGFRFWTYENEKDGIQLGVTHLPKTRIVGSGPYFPYNKAGKRRIWTNDINTWDSWNQKRGDYPYRIRIYTFTSKESNCMWANFQNRQDFISWCRYLNEGY